MKEALRKYLDSCDSIKITVKKSEGIPFLFDEVQRLYHYKTRIDCLKGILKIAYEQATGKKWVYNEETAKQPENPEGL